MKKLSNSSDKNKVIKNKKNSYGFTLIELLATITILSIVLSISIYFVYEIVDNARNKSYQVTISNIEKEAGTYVLENASSVEWINDNDMSYQYQCVSIQNLIDSGYFSGDVLNSKVDKDVYVQKNDMVYLERNIYSKTITNSVLLVGDRTNFSGLCGNVDNNTSGNITFKVEPSGWAKEKDITIYYSISNNNDDVSNYTYSYNYFLEEDGSEYKKLSDNFNGSIYQELVTVDKNGDLIAKISNGERLLFSKTLNVNDIDNIPPTCTLSVTTDNISMDINDNVGVINKGITMSDIPDYNGYTKIDLTTGTIYGYVKDVAGNTGSCSVDIAEATSLYNCSKSAVVNERLSCTSSIFNNPSSACTNLGYTYYSNTCSRTYTATYQKCQYDTNTSNHDTLKFVYAGIETGLAECTTTDFYCSWDTQEQIKISSCQEVVLGYVSCYYMSCDNNGGTYDNGYCYKYNQTSCEDDWTAIASVSSCESGYTNVGNYCYK